MAICLDALFYYQPTTATSVEERNFVFLAEDKEVNLSNSDFGEWETESAVGSDEERWVTEKRCLRAIHVRLVLRCAGAQNCQSREGSELVGEPSCFCGRGCFGRVRLFE